MPFFVEILKQMFIVLPALIIVEGWHKLSRFLSEKKLWWHLPYVLVAILSFILIILLLNGYR